MSLRLQLGWVLRRLRTRGLRGSTVTPRPEDLPPHLRYVTSSRGALHLPELHTHAHGSLHLSESTASTGAYVWLRASAANSLDQPLTDRTEVVLHVSLEDLAYLVEQAEFLLDHHRKAGLNVD